jgi:hypothetical protein
VPSNDHEGEVVRLKDPCHVDIQRAVHRDEAGQGLADPRGAVSKDAGLTSEPRVAVTPLDAYLEEAAEILTIGRQARGRRRQRLTGALRHALAFSTWHSLSTNGVGRADATTLVTALVEAADGDRRMRE